MAKSIPALINPLMLVWARKSARITIEDAAEKAGINIEKLIACESGKQNLTFKQLMSLAKIYKRSVSLFYLKAPPKDWQPIKDFRRLPNSETGFTPSLAYVIRQAQERRILALELKSELNERIRPFDFSANITQDIETLGNSIRNYLGVSKDNQQKWKRSSFEQWRAIIESFDILVFTVPRLPIEEMRGAAIAEKELPIILVNAKDRTNGRVFTLLHEFTHLLLSQSGVSGFGGDRNDAPAWRIERFCNAVASAALIPKDWLLNEPLVKAKGTAKTWDDEELEALAGQFGVSREAVLRRLLTLDKTTQTFYDSRRAAFLKEYQELADKKSDGGPQHHIQVLSQLGRNFTKLVLRSYHERYLTLRDVANHFNMQAGAVSLMERAAFKIGG